ncbi:YraN family protein [Nitratiruptor sp. SB155-2]|uniref:UPF0102 protein NIS_1551 n=1 Tax=Nitratiruptor sp. (strain SB155-2) TaxID=387092 RepID=Y1551_NITSB|nr:YraN family protein [Nitratiruptor sp. SB155-2]A6Q599.1 RecName: Full=UPF0102 protein NIS_1551 [Nitratiruptor sp. SB155-2]BAF70658.1 conserved hypothetical protein [Nitratiruptor sp. SB155-2]
MGLKSYLLGRNGEKRAEAFLIKNGFTIREKNFHSRFGEIDIIAQKDGILHFIEVKLSEKSDPVYMITQKKMEKLLLAIEFYMMKNGLELPYQIDGVLIKKNTLEMIENLTIM